MQEVERGMLDAKEREKVLFIEMRREKTWKVMKYKARVKVSCTKQVLEKKDSKFAADEDVCI